MFFGILRMAALACAALAAAGCATITNDPTVPIALSFSDGSGGEDGLRIARFIQERKEPAMPMPITVSELRVSKKGKREHHRHRDDKL